MSLPITDHVAEEKNENKKMNKIKKLFGIAVLAVIGFVNISLYRNIHMHNKTRTIGNYEEKIQILEDANKIYPYNYRVHNDLGRIYFELASLDFQNVEQRDDNFEKSIQSFTRSITLNPGYYQSHFYFAQALSYLQYFAPIEVNYYDEYKKAARLTTFDTQAYFEVGRFLFTHWAELSEEDQHYTLGLLKNLKTTGENLQTIMQIWAINGGDFSVIEDILPREPGVYRTFAQFLAERKLSLSQRHKKLAQAEQMDFLRAKNSFTAGERQAQLQNVSRAVTLFRESLKTIENIRFYQNLTGETLIDLPEFNQYKKNLYLNIAKNQIIKSRNLKDGETYLRKYLDVENNATEIGALEIFFNERNLLKAEPGTYFNDLFPYYVKVLIESKQNRSRDIIEGGKKLKESFSTPPEALRKDLARICQLIGESYQELDFLYDAGDFFNLALSLDSTHLDSLKGLSQNFLRLNEPEKAEEVQNQIENMLSPEEINFENLTIRRGQSFTQTFILKEKKVGLILSFKEASPGPAPLVAVEFNDQLIWEDYLESQSFSLILNANEGTNVLTIQPIIRAVTLKKIVYTADNERIQDIERDRTAVYESSKPQIALPLSLEEELLEREQNEPRVKPVKIKSASTVQEEKQRPSMSFINGMEYAVSQNSLEIEVLIDHFLSFNKFELSNPNRIVLDISGIADIRSARRFELGEFPVQEIRVGMFKFDTARVVFYVDQNSLRYSVEKTQRGLKIIFVWD